MSTEHRELHGHHPHNRGKGHAIIRTAGRSHTHTHILLGYNGGFLVLAVFQVCFPPSPLQMNLMHVVVGAYVEFVLSSGRLHNTYLCVFEYVQCAHVECVWLGICVTIVCVCVCAHGYRSICTYELCQVDVKWTWEEVQLQLMH